MAVKGLKDTIKWYDENAKNYALASKDLYSMPAIDKFVSYLMHGAKVLDAGCGSGRDSALLKSKGFEVTGIDISAGLLKEAGKAHADINFVMGDLLALPFPDNEFDGIWAHASLVHLETPEDTQRAIKEFYRVLNTGGIVHIFVKEQTNEKKTDIVSDKLSNSERFFQYYTKGEIVDMLENSGFAVQFIENNVSDTAGRKETTWIWAVGKKV